MNQRMYIFAKFHIGEVNEKNFKPFQFSVRSDKFHDLIYYTKICTRLWAHLGYISRNMQGSKNLLKNELESKTRFLSTFFFT